MFGFLLECACSAIEQTADFINESLEDYTPAEIVTTTTAMLATLYAAQSLYSRYYYNYESVTEGVVEDSYQLAKRIPIAGRTVRALTDKEVNKILGPIEDKIRQFRTEHGMLRRFPQKGVTPQVILDRIKTLHAQYLAGRMSGGVYTAKRPEELQILLQEIFTLTELVNSLHDKWPMAQLIEAEFIAMSQALFGGKVGGFGYVTHGGSTSIEAALYSYSRLLPIGRTPEVIVPASAHPAFEKAAHKLRMKIHKVPVDAKTGKAIPSKMAKKINKNTVLIVGSAPSFPHGVIDSIEEIAAIAKKHNIGCHVDCCLGGGVLAYIDKTSRGIAPCDLSVDGVTSLSYDPHKFNMTKKGVSVILYAMNRPIKGQSVSTIETFLNTHMGMYVTPGADGSRSFLPVAVAWAVMLYYGQEGYQLIANSIIKMADRIRAGVASIEGLRVHGDSKLMVVGVTSNDKAINIMLVKQKMHEKDWVLNTTTSPKGFHLCLTHVHISDEKRLYNAFMTDLKEAVAYARANPHEKPGGDAGAYQMIETGLIPKSVQRTIGERYQMAVSTLVPDDAPMPESFRPRVLDAPTRRADSTSALTTSRLERWSAEISDVNAMQQQSGPVMRRRHSMPLEAHTDTLDEHNDTEVAEIMHSVTLAST